MELTSPYALLYLPLAVLVFLLARRRQAARTLGVGNLFLWRRDTPPDGARLTAERRQQNWLAALQAACVLAMVAALTGPLVLTRATNVVIVVDASASMGAREGSGTRMDLARARAQALADGLPARSRVRLLAARTMVDDLGRYQAGDAALRQRIAAILPSAGTAALADAIDMARIQDGADAVIHVFSDAEAPEAGGGGRVRWTRVGGSADNLAITAMAARALEGSPAQGQVLVEIRNFAAAARETEVEVSQRGRIVAVRTVRVEPRASAGVLAGIDMNGGVVTADLNSDDALEIDDRRFALPPPGERMRVRLITRGNFFLERVLAARPGVELEVQPPGKAAEGPAADVVVCDGCGDLPPGDAGVLLIAAVPGPAVSGDAAGLMVVERSHPLARSLDVADVAAVAIPRASPSDAAVIVRAGSLPVITVQERSGRRVVEWRLDLASSNLPLSAAFPVMVANTLDWLAARGESANESVAGEPLRWTLAAPRLLADVSVTGPGGRKVPFRASGNQFLVSDTDAPGVYQVKGRGIDRAFVVNPSTEAESDLGERTPVSPSSPPPASLPVGADTVPREMSVYLLLAGIGLLTVEWLHVSRGKLRP